MKARVLFILLFLLVHISKAQTDSVVTIREKGIPLTSLLKRFEETSPYKFFYINRWVDSVKIDLNMENKPVREIIIKTLQNAKIDYFINGQRIILLNNTPIIEKLDAGFFAGTSGANSEDTFIFKREFIPNEKTEERALNAIIEVGRRDKRKGRATLVGYIRDRKTNETISDASVYVELLGTGTISNGAGFYSISIPVGSYTIVVKYVGMIPEKKQIILYGDGKLDFSLMEDVISLKEVTIKADADANISSTQMGKSILDMKAIKNVPKVLGENDILRVAQMLPGVKSVGEGSSGLNVRGGNADQNLMLLNEATIYNSSHFLGFFSVFNADAIKTSELYKSGIPAQFGGRLSSIFDIQLKDGNQKKFSGYGGISPVAARLNFELPLVKEKTSLIFGGRTTYSDWILHQIPTSTLSNANASFYDAMVRLTHKFNDNSFLSASYYYSYDKFQLGNDSTFSYSNQLFSLQWRTRINDNLHSQLSLTHSGYSYAIDYKQIPQNAFNLGFGIQESNAKWDLNLYRNRHKFDFGAQSKLYDVNPGYINPNGISSIVEPQQIQLEKGLESAAYLADNFDLTPSFSVYAGLRFSSFTALGPGTVYSYQPGQPKNNTTLLDSTKFTKNQPIKTYAYPEYRFSLRYNLRGQSSVKLSYNRTRQYLHMLSNTISVSPTTTWKLSDHNILPQLADQVSAGFYKNLFGNAIEASVEVYYKWLNNVLDYKIGSDLILNNHIEQDVLQGQGKAYGIELLLRKRTGKLNGWLGYTYSRTFLKMNGASSTEKINGGAYYPANYDKPHDISLVINYKFTRRYSLSTNFVYTTGRPITYPVGQYYFGGGYKIDYSDRNAFRIPDYVRLDIGVNIEGNHKIKQLAHGYWNISIYNVLGRRNPYSIYFTSDNGVIKGYQLSIFGAPIPTVTYNFKF